VGAQVQPNTPARIVVQPDFTNLTPGAYQGSLTFQFNDGSSQNVSILSVVAPPGLANPASDGAAPALSAPGCNPSRLNMLLTTPQNVTAKFGEPSNLGVRILDNCGDPVTSATRGAAVRVSFSPAIEPAQPLEHIQDGRWTKTFQARTMRSGTVRASVTAFVALPNGSILADQIELQISISDVASTPVISPGAVVNGASFAANAPIAPGSLVSIYGSGLADSDQSALGLTSAPLEFNSVQVRLGERPLPLFYVGREQINAQIPFDLPLNTQHQIIVRKGTTLSVPDSFVVGPAQPAIFAQNLRGFGQGSITNGVTNVLADVYNPVRAGDVISIYCTGLGRVSPSVTEGTQAPLAPLSWTVDTVRVTIGGRDAQVQFSGLGPTLVGVYQVNAFVPAGVTGDQVPVVIETGGLRSPPVTIAIR
jgi:uncharacterized protein (TIGR03437 family)